MRDFFPCKQKTSKQKIWRETQIQTLAGNAHRKIMIHDGNLKMYEKKDYSPLTFSFLEQHLGKIMTDPQQVEFVIQYLKEQREIKTTSDIKRNYKEINN